MFIQFPNLYHIDTICRYLLTHCCFSFGCSFLKKSTYLHLEIWWLIFCSSADEKRGAHRGPAPGPPCPGMPKFVSAISRAGLTRSGFSWACLCGVTRIGQTRSGPSWVGDVYSAFPWLAKTGVPQGKFLRSSRSWSCGGDCSGMRLQLNAHGLMHVQHACWVLCDIRRSVGL